MAVHIHTKPGIESADFAYSASDDAQLYARFAEGDGFALDVLMRRHRGLVWTVVRKYLKSLNEAEDIFQDISLALYQNPHAFQQGNAKFSSWLYRVVTNKCLDIVRSKSFDCKEGNLDDTIPSDQPNAEDVISSTQLSARLKSLIGLLPVQQQRAISLYYFDEKEMNVISREMEITEGAARALIKRGREKLREMSDNQALSTL